MLVRGGTVVTFDESGQVLTDGAVIVRDGRIVAVGSEKELAPLDDGEVIDARGMLVMPGMVCAHTHLAHSLARWRVPCDLTAVEIWSEIEERFDYEAIRYGTMWAAIEAARGGVTTVIDDLSAPEVTHLALDAAAEGLSQVGLRGVLSYRVSDRHGPAKARQGAEENGRFARRVATEPLLASLMALDACHALSDTTLRLAVSVAAVADTGFYASVGTFRAEGRECELRYGQRPLARLRRLGILGRRTLVGPCISLEDEEVDLLRRQQATVVYAPRALADRNRTQPGASELLARGVSVCLGTDGYGHDLFAEASAAYRCARSGSTYVQALNAAQIVSLVWQHGGAIASQLFKAQLGVLAPGALADLILVDYAWASEVRMDNLGWHLLDGLEAARVDTTIVGGQVIMRHGALLNVDAIAVGAQARVRAAALV